MIDNKI